MNITNIPDKLSYLRIAMIPLLWLIYFSGKVEMLAFGILIAGITDIFDGYLARKNGTQSGYGSKLDSLADNLLALSMIFWTFELCPEIFRNHSTVLYVWSVLLIISAVIGFIKFRRIGNLHLYSSKAAAVFSYAFVIHAYIFGYNLILFYISISSLIAAAIELILLQILNEYVDEHMGSVLLKR